MVPVDDPSWANALGKGRLVCTRGYALPADVGDVDRLVRLVDKFVRLVVTMIAAKAWTMIAPKACCMDVSHCMQLLHLSLEIVAGSSGQHYGGHASG